MGVTVGDMQSIGTLGWWVTIDVSTPPDPPTVPGTFSVTTTTATIDYTEPGDADFDDCDADYYEEGVWTRTNKDPFTGQLTGLTPGTTYYVFLHAFDTSGNRSAPSRCVRLTTRASVAGTYNLTVAFRGDEATEDEVSHDLDITKDVHRAPIEIRAASGQIRLTMKEVDQNIKLLSMELFYKLLGRVD